MKIAVSYSVGTNETSGATFGFIAFNAGQDKASTKTSNTSELAGRSLYIMGDY
ncbi:MULTISPECIES: hypothetical protein [Nostoc]|uniref:Uncharacterized protein n=1 Tax=Nostoc paludosum FACHB-159 TaxID=2692908 RepID=A0ABR8KAL4_9NOSO|nr:MULTISPECIES: hypothetical protein [Nostoc]MBD2679501.1 hypothetical protein [Nostoc sp. FACHB-857]MBD2735759.1 hypothetical protein [Nostoc paludosum FACHB-159]